jgi:hypothetical protein
VTSRPSVTETSKRESGARNLEPVAYWPRGIRPVRAVDDDVVDDAAGLVDELHGLQHSTPRACRRGVVEKAPASGPKTTIRHVREVEDSAALRTA